MRKFLYKATGTAKGVGDNVHGVTVVGLVEQDSVITMQEDPVKVSNGKHLGYVDGMLVYPKKHFARKLTIAYSICHPDDLYDPQIGIDVAKKRLKENPLGTIFTNCITMLQKEDVEAILQAKCDYICDNIDKFVKKHCC